MRQRRAQKLAKPPSIDAVRDRQSYQLHKIPMPEFTNPLISVNGITPDGLQSSQSQFLIVDARSWLEYITGHIPGAVLFDRERVLAEIPKDRQIVVACLSGNRSASAAQWLVTQGYSQVYNLEGGLVAWKHANRPVQAGNQP